VTRLAVLPARFPPLNLSPLLHPITMLAEHVLLHSVRATKLLIMAPYPRTPDFSRLQTILGVPWSYPENLEALLVPEFLVDRHTEIHANGLIYIEAHLSIIKGILNFDLLSFDK